MYLLFSKQFWKIGGVLHVAITAKSFNAFRDRGKRKLGDVQLSERSEHTQQIGLALGRMSGFDSSLLYERSILTKGSALEYKYLQQDRIKEKL